MHLHPEAKVSEPRVGEEDEREALEQAEDGADGHHRARLANRLRRGLRREARHPRVDQVDGNQGIGDDHADNRLHFEAERVREGREGEVAVCAEHECEDAEADRSDRHRVRVASARGRDRDAREAHLREAIKLGDHHHLLLLGHIDNLRYKSRPGL